MPRRSLRWSLLAGVIGLTASALLIVDTVSVLALRAYLVHQTDEQLAAAATLVRRRTPLLASEGQAGETLRSVVSVTDYLVEVRRVDGTTLRLLANAQLPPRPLLDGADPSRDDAQTVRTSSGARYRVVVTRVGAVVVLVGLSLAQVDGTVARVQGTALLLSGTMLVLLAGSVRVLITRRLRPLDEIAAAATALAQGDLDRRVPAPDPAERAAGTETGRLSLAINGMLARIQAALTARAQSEERMRQFVADASHELRTPVTSIKGYLQLIRSGVVDLNQRPDVLRRLEDEATRMGVLVTDLLCLARLDADPPERRERVDVVAIVAEAVADAQAVESDRPLTIAAPVSRVITADSHTVRQVVANLLANVRAHTPAGTPATVSVHEDEYRDDGGEERRGVRVAVADTGPGMTSDEVAHAFDRFWRAGSTRPTTSGAGLGLAIVAEVVRAHGGRVGIDATPGAGTTVWFTLPDNS